MKIPSSLAGDILIIVLCATAVVLFIFAQGQDTGSGYLSVQTADGIYRYSLKSDRSIVVKGPLGDTHIEIREGKARIVDSACPNKTCTIQSPIDRSGSFIACLPNHVLLTIVGPMSEEIDDVAY
ncbi:MAG: NusG domain II-containing protein [Spirochaetales bacterium]|nr:NusG domain II-containing protein [Spirochaetales bacterium]